MTDRQISGLFHVPPSRLQKL